MAEAQEGLTESPGNTVMSVIEKLSEINDYVQLSFRNGMNTVEKLHQTTAEIPLDMASELGFSKDQADMIKGVHRRMLKSFYGAVIKANKEVGDLVVKQATELRSLASNLQGSGASGGGKSVPRKKAAKKSAPTVAAKKNGGES